MRAQSLKKGEEFRARLDELEAKAWALAQLRQHNASVTTLGLSKTMTLPPPDKRTLSRQPLQGVSLTPVMLLLDLFFGTVQTSKQLKMEGLASHSCLMW